MRNALCSLLILTAALASSPQSSKGRIDGNWVGTLDISGVKLRLLLKVTKTDAGYAAKLDSLDQGSKDLPIDVITMAADRVSFSAARLGISYDGKLSQTGDEIDGTFKQGPSSTALRFSRVEGIPANARRQDPKKPYPYLEEEVTYENRRDRVKLAGTLTLPRGAGKVPAVILITGSGSQDRDETIAGHRPFLVLADHLTRKGIAVLRVDDRGIGGSGGDPRTATTENYVGDVMAGVEYLKTRKDIDAKHIGVIGHSEGGAIAPMAAARSKDVAFIVLLAGPGQTGRDVILTQLELIQRANGATPDAIAASLELERDILSIIIAEPDDKLAGQKIGEMLTRRESRMNDQERRPFAKVMADIKGQLPLLLSPWYRYFLAYDPVPALRKVKVPVLALNGEADTQISAKQNLALISAGLKAGGNKDVTVRAFPHLNHLFQTSRTGLPAEYGSIDETISPDVLETISTWILGRVSK